MNITKLKELKNLILSRGSNSAQSLESIKQTYNRIYAFFKGKK